MFNVRVSEFALRDVIVEHADTSTVMELPIESARELATEILLVADLADAYRRQEA